MAKKPTRKKRVATKEADYEVQMKDTSPAAKVQSRATKVSAASPEAAIKAATGGKPTSDKEVVTVRKDDPSNNTPNVTIEAKKHSMKTITETVKYPYSFSVPRTFSEFLESVGLEYSSIGNNVMVKFENKSQLTEGLRTLNKSKDNKSKIIIDGISRNI